MAVRMGLSDGRSWSERGRREEGSMANEGWRFWLGERISETGNCVEGAGLLVGMRAFEPGN
jgi:hypothetical protein